MAPSRRNGVLAPAHYKTHWAGWRIQDLQGRLTSEHDETDADDS
ncbi:hypothetical protein ABZ672_48340 [Streptomyces mirabilis]